MTNSAFVSSSERVAVLALLLFAGSSPAAAQRSSRELQIPEASEDSGKIDARELNRILYLRGGTVLRARARWVDDHWEYRTGGSWRPLPEDSVERAAIERDVLEQAKRLEAELGTDLSARRVGLADWMLRAGLLVEALAQLDRVLDAHPDEPSALELLAHPPVPFSLFGKAEEDVDELVRQAAGSTASMREVALVRLSELEAPEVLLERFQKDLVSHSVRLRSFAALGLRRMFPGAALRGLASRAILDGSQDVRESAALALRAADEPAVVLPSVRALQSVHANVRENAAESLGTMGYREAVEPLMSRLAALSAPQSGGGWRAPGSHIFVGKQVAYISDFDVEVAQGSSIADPQVSVLTEGSVLDVRVIGVTVQSFATESRKLRRSLAQITGADPGDSAKSWLEWWEKNKSKWTGPDDAPPPPTTDN